MNIPNRTPVLANQHSNKSIHRKWLVAFIAIIFVGCVSAPDAIVDSPAQTTRQHPVEFMLSFDDGPLHDATERVLDMLAKLNNADGKPVKAGFFLLSNSADGFLQRRVTYAPYELWTNKGSIEKYPDIARRIKQEGHVIGNHTAHHPWFRWPWTGTREAVQAELALWEATSTRVLGASNTRVFRPPYLVLNENVEEIADQLGYQLVMGESVEDTAPNVTLEEVFEETVAILQAWDKPYPCVLIFHDSRPTTYMHLTETVENLQRKGFKLVDFDPSRL